MPKPVTLTVHGSLVPVRGNHNHAFISNSCDDHLATSPLFQKAFCDCLVLTTLLWAAPVSLRILPIKSPIWKLPTPEL